MSEFDMIMKRLEELGAEVREGTRANHAVATSNAVLTERLDHIIEKTEENAVDIEDQRVDIQKLKDWRTGVMAKVGSYAAIASMVFGFLFAVAKEAIADWLP